jgi:hypothetical protein
MRRVAALAAIVFTTTVSSAAVTHAAPPSVSALRTCLAKHQILFSVLPKKLPYQRTAAYTLQLSYVLTHQLNAYPDFFVAYPTAAAAAQAAELLRPYFGASFSRHVTRLDSSLLLWGVRPLPDKQRSIVSCIG